MVESFSIVFKLWVVFICVFLNLVSFYVLLTIFLILMAIYQAQDLYVS